MGTAVTNTIIGYFRTRSQAEKTVEDLIAQKDALKSDNRKEAQ